MIACRFGTLFNIQQMCECTAIIYGAVFATGRIYRFGNKAVELLVNFLSITLRDPLGSLCFSLLQI